MQSKASLFCSQKGKGSSWQIIDEQSNEFWLAQSCSVDKCSFTMPSIISFGVACNSKQTFFHERLFTIIMSLKHKRSVLSIKDEQSIIFQWAEGKKEIVCELNMALVSSRSPISARARKRSWRLMHLSIEIPTHHYIITNLNKPPPYWGTLTGKTPPWWGNLCCSLTDY